VEQLSNITLIYQHTELVHLTILAKLILKLLIHGPQCSRTYIFA